MSNEVKNPYVGPRPFTREERRLFSGREREVSDLLSWILSEQLVLFYAQSGAGKSSLINASLIPDLEEEGFEVLPVGRVSGKAQPGLKVDNIFVYNLLLSLDQSKGDPSRFAKMTLADFLDNLVKVKVTDGECYYYDDNYEYPDDYEIKPRALIIDQFEEIRTANLEEWEKRADFFKQLREAIDDDPSLSVVLSMREDYVAALDPYTHLLPDRLQSRFHMQPMDDKAAMKAVTEPAKKMGCPFTQSAAMALVNNLRRIRTQEPSGSPSYVVGQFIEPVELQVVCYQLWKNLLEEDQDRKEDQDRTEITDEDLKRLAGGEELGQFVDKALAQFYEQAIDEVKEDAPGRTEFALRDWFENKLITKARTRAPVLQEAQQTGGVDNDIVRELAKRFLLRAEPRAGSWWYELVHDRFVDPILQANADWRQDHPLIQVALEWKNAGEAEGKLYQGPQLAEALEHPDAQIGLVRKFLKAGQEVEKKRELAIRAEEEKKRADEQASAAQRMRLLASGLFVVFLLTVIATVFAIMAQQRAVDSAQEAEYAAATAAAAEATAVVDKDRAIEAHATAVAAEATAVVDKDRADKALSDKNEAIRIANARSLAGAALDNLREWGNPDLSVLYAIKAARLSISGDTPVIEAHDALNQALQYTAVNPMPIQTLYDHSDEVVSVVFNKDGTLLATAGKDGRAIIWDTLTWGIYRTLDVFPLGSDSPSGRAVPIAFDQDGALAAVSPLDRTSITIWNTDTGAEIETIPTGHSATIWSIAFSPDGQYLATADQSGVVEMWNLASDERLWRIEAHTDGISSVTFSPDSLLVATASKDATARIWDVLSGDEEAFLDDHTAWINQIAFVGDGAQVVTASDDSTAKLWDFESGADPIDLPEPYDAYIHSIAFSQAEGQPRLAMVNNRGTVIILDKDVETNDWEITSEFSSHSETVWNLALSPDGTRLATVSGDTTAIIWNLELPGELHPIKPISVEEIFDLATSPEGHYLASVRDDDGPIQLLGFTADTEIDPIQISPGITVTQFTLSTDGRHLATIDDAGVPQVWDISSGKAENPQTLPPLVITADPSLSKEDTTEQQTAEQADQIDNLALNRDGTLLAVEGHETGLKVWDVETGKEMFTLDVPNFVSALAFSPNNPHLARANTNFEVNVWNIQSGELLFTLSPAQRVIALTFNDDGSLLATADDTDNNIRVWQIDSAERRSVTFSGRKAVNALMFNRDSSQIMAARDDGTVRFYSLDINKLLDVACQYTGRNLTWFEWQSHQREIGEEPEDSRICDLPIHNSIVEEYIRQGEEGIKKARILLEAVNEKPKEQIAQALLAYAEQQISQSRYADALELLNQAIDFYPELRSTQTIDLATDYYQVCRSFRGFDFRGDVKTACEQAVSLAAKTDDATLNFEICQYNIRGNIEGFDVSSVCDQVIDLTTKTEDASLSLDICLQGIDAGLDDFVKPICTYALEHPNLDQSMASNLELCRIGGSRDSEALFSSVCQRVIETTIPHIGFSEEISDTVESSEGDYWVFSGTKDQMVTIAMGGFDTYLELWEPDQLQTIIEDDDGGAGLDGSNSMIKSFPLPKDGLYIINARGYGGEIGEYHLTLTEEIVKPIGLNKTVTENIADQSLWAFEGEPGQIVSIAMDTTSADFNPSLTLLGPDLTELTYNDDISGENLNARIQGFILPEEGRYLIKAGGIGTFADYTLSLTEEVPQPIAFGELEIDDITQVTAWTFAGEAGQIVMIAMDEADSDQEIDLTLLGSDGEKLGDRVSSLVINLPQTGPYTILAQGYQEDVERYTLSLREITEELGSLTYGDTVSGEIMEASADYWAFSGNAGEAAKISIASSSFSPNLGLYNPNGELIGEYDNSDPTREDLSRLIQIRGTHIIAVSGVDDSQSGSYTLSLAQTDILPVLVWTAYTDVDEEYAHVLDALSRLAPSAYEVTETDTTDEGILESALAGHLVFLIPEQEKTNSETLAKIGSRFEPVLEKFVRQGGWVISLGEWGDHEGFLRAMGLLDASYTTLIHPGAAEIVNGDSPVAQGLPTRIDTEDATASYMIRDIDATIVVEAEDGDAVVATRSIGSGQVVLIGYDYYESNNAADQLLVNAVFWPR